MNEAHFLNEMFFYINSIGKQEEFFKYLSKSDKKELLSYLEVEQ